MHAIKVLREDHARIETLLNELADQAATPTKPAERLERELVVHILAEDNVFLPYVQEAVEDGNPMTEELFGADPGVLVVATELVAQSYETNAWIQDLLRGLPPVPTRREIEDLLAVQGQGRAIPNGSRYVLHGREENSTIHDEVGMRHYYAEWSRRMGRLASDPTREVQLRLPTRA
ncbi:MAG TPA: hypothetical protein VEP28_07120 [Rubrobacter sp.]|nr:hypothetical protein [Rubrobacter sp.]